MWQAILYPPIFCRVIDAGVNWLFSWRSKNISPLQKHAAYAHLYSFASTKSVVHWFQIMRHARFVMYDDDAHGPRATAGRAYRPAKFPTRNIATQVVLMYGDTDSLVDIDAMRRELPPQPKRSSASCLPNLGNHHRCANFLVYRDCARRLRSSPQDLPFVSPALGILDERLRGY